MRRALLFALVPIAFLSASLAAASPTPRHEVRIDVVEIVPGRAPKSHHYDVIVDADGTTTVRQVGAVRLEARWEERHDGKPTLSLKLDRDGTKPMHWSSRFRPILGVPQLRFGTSSKAGATDVFLTVL